MEARTVMFPQLSLEGIKEDLDIYKFDLLHDLFEREEMHLNFSMLIFFKGTSVRDERSLVDKSAGR